MSGSRENIVTVQILDNKERILQVIRAAKGTTVQFGIGNGTTIEVKADKNKTMVYEPTDSTMYHVFRYTGSTVAKTIHRNNSRKGRSLYEAKQNPRASVKGPSNLKHQ